jgi:hypothetical protein
MLLNSWLTGLRRFLSQNPRNARRRVTSQRRGVVGAAFRSSHIESLEDRLLLSGVQTFQDNWGAQTTSNADGTTLDFSAVTGGLEFSVQGDVVTVAYADANRTDRLTFNAHGQNYSLIGSKASDRFVISDNSQLALIDSQQGHDTVRFDQTIGLTRTGDSTTATRLDNSTFTFTDAEILTGRVSLGSAIRSEVDQSFQTWTNIASSFVESELLSAKTPFLDVSLAEGLGRGFASSVPATLNDAKAYAKNLLTVETSSLNTFTDLGALASGLETAFNAATSGNPFTVTAGIYDWSELRFDVSFDAAKTFTFAPSLSPAIQSALGAAGIALSAISNLDVQTRLGGSLEVGIRLDGLSAFNATTGITDRGFLRVQPISVEVDSHFANLTASAGLSAQEFGSAATVSIVNGVVDLNARAQMSLDPATADGPWRRWQQRQHCVSRHLVLSMHGCR